MRRIVLASLTALMLAAPFGTGASQATSTTAQKIAVPAYFDPPSSLWTQMENASATVGLAIINPADGPGKKSNAAYVAEVKRAQAAGMTVIGYVLTNYGKASTSTVESQINNYYSWYKVDGIFIDEASNDCKKTSYYKTLYNFILAKTGKHLVVINPGTTTGECYMAVADVIVTFESTYAAYVTYTPDAWTRNYPASRFWHLVFKTTEAQMPDAIAKSKARNAGYVYVTPDNLPNPWDTLPQGTYWTGELSRAAS